MLLRIALLLATLLPLATGFTAQRVALLHPSKAASKVVLFEIDEKSVTDSVSVEQSPKEVAPPPPPAKVTDAGPLPSLDEEEAPEAKTAVAAPTWSGGAPSLDAPDLPLPLIGGGLLAAFAAATFAMRGREDAGEGASTPAAPAAAAPAPKAAAPAPAPEPAPAPAPPAADDVSIPYDAAALLAYDEWRAANGKGDFNAAKFEKFKSTYESVAVANVVAKKVARESGSEATIKSLPANADE